MKTTTIYITLLLLLFNAYTFAQCNTTPPPPLTFINPSFEGPSCAGCQPGPWNNCGGTPDTQPGSWGFTQAASDGNSYVSFLQSGSSATGYYEGSSQQLSSCMVAGQQYTFSIDLAHSNVYNTAEPNGCYSSLEILGSNSLCDPGELLWQSGIITHTNWQTYTVTLTPTQNWCYVTFRPYFISGCNGYVNIMLDNLGPLQAPGPSVDATVSSSISCSQDITGTNTCPVDSIILTGLFTGATINATLLTDSTWQSNVTYPIGSSSTQQISVHTYFQAGVDLYDTINFNLVEITPNFGFTSACLGGSTTFSDSSTLSSGTIIGWAWDFGDNSPVNTTQNPTHTYSNSGTYNVVLLVNSSDGCADTVSKQVRVFDNPMASFSSSNVCLSDSMHFANSSSAISPDSITNLLWHFGDGGNTSTLSDPVHLYNSTGQYNVTLIATTALGCSNAVSNLVNVFDAPPASFTFMDACASNSTLFTNTSLNPTTGTIGSWLWNFGDGTPPNTSAISPNHSYTTAGTYEVTLIVNSSNLGCADTVKDSITVYPNPSAQFIVSDVCLNDTSNFTDLSTVNGSSIISWQWIYDDGSANSTLQNSDYTYSAPGTYNVNLIVTTIDGCKDTVAQNTIVHPLPAAQFNSNNVCFGNSTTFTDISTIEGTDIIQTWQWNFGDNGSYNTNQNCSYAYPSSGTYSAQLLITSQFGCTDSITHAVTVNPNPIVNFAATDSSGCEPLCVNFQNQSTIESGVNSSFLWDFGINGQNSNSENPTHCFTNDSIYSPISYSVTLTVTSESGCTNSFTKNNYIVVYPMPIANFEVQPTTASITEPLITISDLSSGAANWYWTFGDSTFDSVASPIPHVYKDTGTYTIMLITTTQYGCIDTLYKTAIIEPTFLIYIPNAFSPNGDGINDSFFPQGIYIKEFEMMIFDRWGNFIFYSDDITKPWNGRANYGTDIAQQDVYVYSIKVTDFLNKKHTYRGTVTLVR